MAEIPVKDLEDKFSEAGVKINSAIGQLAINTAVLKDTDLEGHLALYRVVYEADKHLEAAMKLLGELKRTLGYEAIPNIMEAKTIDNIKFNGRTYIRAVRLDASIPKHMQNKGFAWLREAGLEGVIAEGANAKTLSSVLAQYIEETGYTPPEDAIKMHRQPYTMMRK